MKIERNILTLPSGKTLVATALSPFKRREISPVSDSQGPWTTGEEAIPDPLTTAERRELAEYMAARWAEWGGDPDVDAIRTALAATIDDVLTTGRNETTAAVDAILAEFHVTPRGER